ERIDEAYFPPVGALTVLLDDLVDREEDRTAGEHSYLAYYRSAEEATMQLRDIARHARFRIDSLPRADRHRAILAGVGAYYLSSAEAETSSEGPDRSRLLEGLGPGARLLARFMRVRRLGERKRPEQAGSS